LTYKSLVVDTVVLISLLERLHIVDEERGYVLGQSQAAAERLAVQDSHFAEASEGLLDELKIRPRDRVVEFGCGPGAFSRRILRRLGAGGALVAVDATAGLLEQARAALSEAGPARFEPVQADISVLGSWLEGADIVVGRTVLHHVSMAELLLGRLRTALRPGTRVGFLEPDFRSPMARLAYLEATGRGELEPLRSWASTINQLYLARLLSPAVGATLARALHGAGYSHVHETWEECRSDRAMVENMAMFYEEVRDRLISLGIMTAEEIVRQQELLRAAQPDSLPPAWATFRVACEA
jgi:ubiquinone/menaquinone biosynthesis C-methylase UbiE